MQKKGQSRGSEKKNTFIDPSLELGRPKRPEDALVAAVCKASEGDELRSMRTFERPFPRKGNLSGKKGP